MKILIVLLLAFLPFSAFSQTWAPIGATWHYTIPGPGNSPYYDYVLYESVKDTMVEGKQCRLITSGTEDVIMHQNGTEVYYYRENSFRKIYDFGADIGDTVEFEFPTVTAQTFSDTIIAVKCVLQDTIISGSTGLVEYVFSTIPNPEFSHLIWSDYLYKERVGHESKFIKNIEPPSTGADHSLRCYGDDSISYVSDYWEPKNKPCDYAEKTGVEEREPSGKLSLFPDNDWLYIHNLPENGQRKYRIFTLTGKTVAAGTPEGDRIEIKHLAPGIYFLTIQQAGRVHIGKFLKQ